MLDLTAIGRMIDDRRDEKIRELQDLCLQLQSENKTLNRRVAELTEYVEVEVPGLIDQLKAEYENALTQAEQQLAALLEDNRQKQQMYDALLGKMQSPVRFEGVNPMEILGNHFIDVYLRHTKLVMDAHKAGGNIIGLKPRQYTSPSVVRREVEMLEVVAKDKVEMRLNAGIFEFLIGEPEPKPAKDKQPEFTEPVADWFERIVLSGETEPLTDENRKIQHLKIVGESESGKSSFINNALTVVRKFASDVVIKLADPLAGVGESKWDMPSEWSDDDGCREAIEWAAELVERRKQNPRLAHTPTILIVDEIDTVLEGHKDVSAAVKQVWKQGRHVGVWLWTIGQSVNVTAYPGLNLSDFNNCVCVYLNQSVPYAVEQQKSLPPKLADDYFKRVNAGSKYLCMVKPKRGIPFVCESPAPSSFGQSPVVTVCEPETQSASELERIKSLKTANHTTAEIIEKVYGLKPSRAARYAELKRLVEGA